MILDRVEHFEQYVKSIPEICEVLEFVEEVKKEQIPVGKYPLSHGFALVQEGTTRLFEDADFEAHRTYLDIQVLVSGMEYVEYANIEDISVKVSYEEDKDLELLEGTGSKLKILPGMFYVLYPADGHKPCCHQDVPTTYKKVLAKILI